MPKASIVGSRRVIPCSGNTVLVAALEAFVQVQQYLGLIDSSSLKGLVVATCSSHPTTTQIIFPLFKLGFYVSSLPKMAVIGKAKSHLQNVPLDALLYMGTSFSAVYWGNRATRATHY